MPRHKENESYVHRALSRGTHCLGAASCPEPRPAAPGLAGSPSPPLSPRMLRAAVCKAWTSQSTRQGSGEY